MSDFVREEIEHDQQQVLEFPELGEPPVIERTIETEDRYELRLLILEIENFNLKVAQIQAQIASDEARLGQKKAHLEALFQDKYGKSLEDAMKGL